MKSRRKKKEKQKTVGLSMINWRRQRRWNSIFFVCFFVVVLFVCFFLSAPWPAPIPKTQQIVTRPTPDDLNLATRQKKKKILIYDFLLLQQLRGIFRIMSRFSFHRFIFCGMHLVRYWIKKLSKFCWVGVLEKWNYLNKESTVLLRCGHA